MEPAAMIFSEDQQALEEAPRRFVREKLAPKYEQCEREARIDKTRWVASVSSAWICASAIAQSASIRLPQARPPKSSHTATSMAGPQLPSSRFAARSSDVKEARLPRVTRGVVILALLIMEPHAGSDAGALRVKASRDGDNYNTIE
jgi:alkylation response protein AidB-like acyl-CoA dehydrogenase